MRVPRLRKLPGLDEVHPSARQRLRYFEEWGSVVAHNFPDFARAVDTLNACDRARLFSLVVALAESEFARPISRTELRRAIADLRRAQKAIWLINMTQARELILGDEELEDVDLGDQIERAERLLAQSHKKRPVLRDLVRAALVRYVRRTTRRWQDDEVSVLIAVAESVYDEMLERPGNRPVRGAARADKLSEDSTYTAEAHRQWRVRNRKILRGKSDWERRWDARMKNLLYMMDTFPDVRMGTRFGY